MYLVHRMTNPRTIVESHNPYTHREIALGDQVDIETSDGIVHIETFGDSTLVRCASEISLVDDKGAETHGLSVTFEPSPDPHNY